MSEARVRGTGVALPPGMTHSTSQSQPLCASHSEGERILAAALEEFSRHGLEGASEAAIAHRAGVSLAILKRHFSSRRRLFRAAIRGTVLDTLRASRKPGSLFSTAEWGIPEYQGDFALQLEETLAQGVARGELRIANPRLATGIILSTMGPRAPWLVYPTDRAETTAAERRTARTEAIDILVDCLRLRPEEGP